MTLRSLSIYMTRYSDAQLYTKLLTLGIHLRLNVFVHDCKNDKARGLVIRKRKSF